MTTSANHEDAGAPLRSSQELLDQLDEDQRAVASHLSGPLCVLAGAGTGKTRAITYRIANGVAQDAFVPTQVLAVTFTARAASEMRGRLRDLGVPGVQARTFHAAALRQLSYFWPQAVGGSLRRSPSTRPRSWVRPPAASGWARTGWRCVTWPVRSSGRRSP